MITLPVSSSVYQTMVANIQQLHSNSDGTLCITPMQVQKGPTGSQLTNLSSNTSPSMRICRAIITNNSDTFGKTGNLNTNINNNNNNNNDSNKRCTTTTATTTTPLTTPTTINNNNINSNINNNLNNIHKLMASMPRIEHADANHSRAIIDNQGNITIHLGDVEPIKLECESEA